MKYDVFISCKSDKYDLAEKVYDFLTANGLNVFFAKNILKEIGSADYGDAIDNALDQSTHLIVFCSSATEVEKETSPYVHYEWSSFNNEQRSGRKSGNIITILKDMDVADLPFALRKVQSFSYDSFEDHILPYVSTSEHQSRMTDKRENKVEAKSQNKGKLFNLKIKPNEDCKVLIDECERGDAFANKINLFPLAKGEYCLACVSLSYGERKDLEDVNIVDADVLRKVEFTDVNALYKSAMKYKTGDGVEKDIEKAISLFEQAGDLGHGEAFNELGDMYHEAEGVAQDYKKAIKYFTKGVELNNGKACCSLAIMYRDGEGVEQNYGKAVEYFEKGAELGNSHSCYSLACMYKDGEGVAQDYQKAVKYFEKAIELGGYHSCWLLASMYKNGEGVEQNYQKAVEYFEKGIELGDRHSCWYLACMYKDGEGVEQDYQKAIEYFEKGIGLGGAESCRNLALMYRTGNGVEQDYRKAVEYFEKGVELGDADSCYNLADIYMYSKMQNYDKAIEYYQKGADLGDEKCRIELATL